MRVPPFDKKRRLEINEEEEKEDNENGAVEALVALVEHRTKEVEHLRQRIAYYNSQLDEAVIRLEETQVKLARLRGRGGIMSLKTSSGNCTREVKDERRSASPIQFSEDSSREQTQFIPHLGEETSTIPGYYLEAAQKPAPPHDEHSSHIETKSKRQLLIHSAGARKPANPSHKNDDLSQDQMESDTTYRRKPAIPSNESDNSSKIQTKSKPRLVIPAADTLQLAKMREHGNEGPSGSASWFSTSIAPHVNSIVKLKGNKARGTLSEQLSSDILPKGTKRLQEQKEHNELIPLISSCSSPHTLSCQTGCLLSSQHKRKLRSLVLCPKNDQLFVTSALDGLVNLWHVRDRGSSATLLSSTDCQSPNRRWPEDIVWHPQGNSLFSVYSAGNGDCQISISSINKEEEKLSVTFLKEKPHLKGIINSIMFMPWDDTCFVTGGSDHAVVLWTERVSEHSWEPIELHRSIHTSAVMGVAGMQHKKVVMSAGADKRITGFDLQVERIDYKNQIDSKCMSVLPNPCDFNLFMVQTGTPERQLRLFDVRESRTVIHAFGWKQESSESQSALINQSWSPDGLYLTSGSADPIIHIFDIRYNSHKSSQSVRAHHKRVFKAAWHHSLPLLISISSDLNIGLHNVTSL